MFRIYHYLKKKKILSIYLFCMYFFLPFDLTFLDDEIAQDEIELKKKKSIEQHQIFFTILFVGFVIGVLLVIFGGEDGADKGFGYKLDIPKELYPIQPKPKPQFETPTIIKTGCPQNMGRYFDLIDVKTMKKIPIEKVTEDMIDEDIAFNKGLR